MSDIYVSDPEIRELSQEKLDEIDDDPAADEETTNTKYKSADDFIRQEIAPNLPESARKFIMVNPKTKPKQQKKGMTKQNAQKDENVEKSITKTATHSRQASGSRKRKADDAEVGNSDDEEDLKKASIQVTVYVIVKGIKANQAGSSARKGTPQAKLITCGPFFCKRDVDYESFKALIASALPCRVQLLPVSKMQWRYEKPANDKKKPMGTEAGFQALSLSLGQRHKDLVVNVHMPPPAKEEVSWDMGTSDFVKTPFDFESASKADVLPGPASAKEQIARMTANGSTHVSELEAKFPINNHAVLFPAKRVYHDGSRYWELTPLRLQVWAGAIAQGTATLDSPPNSGHFSDQQKLKIQPRQNEAATQVQGHPQVSCPPHYNHGSPPSSYLPPAATYPPVYHYPYPTYHLQHYYPPPPGPFPPPPHPYAQYHNPTPPLASSAAGMMAQVIPSPQPSPRKALRLNISLDVFCNYYDIEANDVPKLRMLGYRPGMPGIENLASKEWEEQAGIKPLTWNFILEAHKQLLKDIRDGKWENSPPQA